jgi:hypothetical protein
MAASFRQSDHATGRYKTSSLGLIKAFYQSRFITNRRSDKGLYGVGGLTLDWLVMDTAERNRRIYEEWLQGAPKAVLARRYGLSPIRVWQIIMRCTRQDLPANMDLQTKRFSQAVSAAAQAVGISDKKAHEFLRVLLSNLK